MTLDATYNIQTGTAQRGIRKEVIDNLVKQTAQKTYKMKQALSIVPTSSWKNTFYREQLTVPAGQTGNATKGIPRGANFPQYSLGWQEVSVRILKYGLEENIPWEDIISGEINVQARTIIRLTEGVVKAIDDQIWEELSQNEGEDSSIVIQSFAIGGASGNGGCWDETSAAISDNLEYAAQLIYDNGNYDTNDLICFVNSYDKRKVNKWIVDKGTQWNSLAQDVVINGALGRLGNVTLVQSSAVPTSYALVVKPKTCATWKELVPIQSNVTEDPFRSTRIRIVEEGTVELTDPKAICLIKNTKRSS